MAIVRSNDSASTIDEQTRHWNLDGEYEGEVNALSRSRAARTIPAFAIIYSVVCR